MTNPTDIGINSELTVKSKNQNKNVVPFFEHLATVVFATVSFGAQLAIERKV